MNRWLGLSALLLCAALVSGAPIPPIEPQAFDMPGFGQKVVTATFQGGERSVVIASGNGRSPLALYVYDADGNCVAKDDLAPAATLDDVAVDWFPPTTGRYTVEMRNPGASANKVQMAIR